MYSKSEIRIFELHIFSNILLPKLLSVNDFVM